MKNPSSYDTKSLTGQSIALIGAGAIGSLLAAGCIKRHFEKVWFYDNRADYLSGKMLDLGQMAAACHAPTRLVRADFIADIVHADTIVISASTPYTANHGRAEVIAENSVMIRHLAQEIRKTGSQARVIIITNPVDVMTTLFAEESRLPREQILGLSGELHLARLKYFLREAGTLTAEESSHLDLPIIGCHWPGAVYLYDRGYVGDQLLLDKAPRLELEQAGQKAATAGYDIMQFLQHESTAFAPVTACMNMIQKLASKTPQKLHASCYLKGEYGLEDLATCVPLIVRDHKIEKIVTFDLNAEEQMRLNASARQTQEILNDLNNLPRQRGKLASAS